MEKRIVTKYDIGDTVLRFNPDTMKLEEFVIKSIMVHFMEGVTSCTYYDGKYNCIEEKLLFASKEEFVNQL